MRLLVCGDRNWTDREYLYESLDAVHSSYGVEVVIEGEARGADILGRFWAKDRGIPVQPYPADWDQYKKAAGPIRNREMLNDGKPDAVIAFHPDILNSKGTRDMVNVARKAGVPVRVLPSEQDWLDSLAGYPG